MLQRKKKNEGQVEQKSPGNYSAKTGGEKGRFQLPLRRREKRNSRPFLKVKSK